MASQYLTVDFNPYTVIFMSAILVERLQEYSFDDATGIGRLMPFLSDRFSDEPIDEDLLRSIIDSTNYEQLVARLEGRIVGVAILSMIKGAGAGNKGWLEDFVTDEEVRGKGIGDSIWSEMMAWCRENEINLEFTSRPSRTAAHNFYRNHNAFTKRTTLFHVDVE